MLHVDRILCMRLWLAVTALLLGLPATAADDPARDALRQLHPAWYDAGDDTWRSVEPPKQQQLAQSNGATGSGFGDGSFFAQLVKGLIYLLAGLVVGVIIYGLWLTFQRKESVGAMVQKSAGRGNHMPAVRHLPMGLGRSRQDPETALQHACDSNDWPAVVVWSYAAALIRLDAAERLRLRAGMTNRACLRALREQRQEFRELMEACEHVHFGHYPATQSDATRALKLLELLAEGPPTPATATAGRAAARATLALLVGALLIGSGCGRGLETDYGVNHGESINGIDVLQDVMADELGAVPTAGLGDHLVAHNGLIHLYRNPGMPPEDDLIYIYEWLLERPNRTCLLILRGDSVTPPLCERWSAQSAASAQVSKPRVAKQLEQLAAAFEQVAVEARNDDRVYTEAYSYSPFLELGLEPAPLLANQRITGAERLELPPRYLFTAQAANTFDIDGDEWEPLIRMGERPLALEAAYGESRMILMLNATTLVNGAMPDPNARQLLMTLTRYLDANTDSNWAWLTSLRRWDGEIAHPNMLDILFRRPPFNIIFLHLLVLGLAFMGSRALWLGRRIDPSVDPHPPFSRHIDAFASWLKRSNSRANALGHLAQRFDVETPHPGRHDDDALLAARRLLHQARRKTSSTPASHHRNPQQGSSHADPS